MTNAEKTVNILRSLDLTLFTAESCTGGLIAKKITDVPGASAVINGGIVSYTNYIKNKLLGVREETLEKFTAVSAETAMEMARGALKYADVAVSVTGYASGGGDVKNSDIGLVFVGIAFGEKDTAVEYHFSGNRSEIREQAAEAALEMIIEITGG